MGRLINFYNKDFRGIDAGERKGLKLETILLIVFLFSVLLMPGFRIGSKPPLIHVSDFLLLPFAFYLVINRKIAVNRYLIITGIWAGFILLSVVINNRLTQIQDLFEIYKVVKFSVYFLFFFQLNRHINYSPIFNCVFYLLFVFNVFHYFDFFEFNNYIEPLFASGTHLEMFGLNSLGEPDTKRMLGTLGNPNTNSIIFLLFSIVFLPKKGDSVLKNINFYLSVIGIFACQSRTGFIALGLIYILYLIFTWQGIKTHLVQLAILVGCFLFISNIDTLIPRDRYIYVNEEIIEKSRKGIETESSASTLPTAAVESGEYKIPKGKKITLSTGDASGTKYIASLFGKKLSENSSLNSRIQTWGKLWEMVKSKPYFGHAPFKQFFYKNGIYSENEYILILWRYGFVGLGIYLMWLLYPLALSVKNFSKENLRNIIYIIVVILVTALTNNPLTESRIFMFYAILTGLFFNNYNKLKNEEEKVASGRK